MTDVLELEALPKDHLSYTQINMHQRCEYQYYLRYCEGITCPIKPAFVFGGGMHCAEEHNFRTRKETGDFPKVSEVQEVFASRVVEIPEEREVDWKERDEKKRDSPAKILDDGTKLITAYNPYARKVQDILGVEEEFKLELANAQYTIVGRRDLRTASTVIDLKTSKRSLNLEQVQNDDQMTVYQIGHDEITALEIHNLVRLKEPKVNILSFPARTLAQRADFIYNMCQRATLIRTGIFPKRRDWKNCSWCGYRIYGHCK